ncbi:MAG: biotin/lipoyl-binding protein [Parachlamydiaceae bacterium]|nr:biotin/lipoyl-binding protein [Parachlamydiaceae bacterium]
MHRKYFLILLGTAFVSMLLAAGYMWDEAHSQMPIPENVIPQPISPFKASISAVGIVEASSKNIFIGSPINRVVDKIYVQVGEKVKAGQTLFCLESNDLQADLRSQKIANRNALARLQKLQSLPRPEDLAFSKAILEGAKVEFAQAQRFYQAIQSIKNSGALSQEEVSRRKYNTEQAEVKVKQFEADFQKTKSGAWQPDIEIAKLEILQAKAAVSKVEIDIERTCIRAPIDATVLQIRVNEGEFPPSDSNRTPPMILGNIDPLHLRVSINQFDASFYNPQAPAVAFLQGNAQQKFPLKFVHIEPYFVDKQNLTNDINEKVDTRVLQAIYCFTENDQRIFVGQQMDVFIETEYSQAEVTDKLP